MRKTLWLLPLCSALYWGACFDPYVAKLSQRERDIRAGLCALCLGIAVLVVAAESKRIT